MSYLVAAVVGGFLMGQVWSFSFGVLIPLLNHSDGSSSITYGGNSTLVLAVLGGLPAAGLSYYMATRHSQTTRLMILKTAWIGPVLMATLLMFLTLIIWPAAAALGLVFAGSSAVAGAVLFELAGAISILFPSRVPAR